MIDKRVPDFDTALAGMTDGATIMSSGFGAAGAPHDLLEAVLERGWRELVIISNNAGEGDRGLIRLIGEKRVAKVICSFPTSSNSEVIRDLYFAGEIELEIVPQGTLIERMRAGGAGIGGFYTRTSVGTPLAEGKTGPTAAGTGASRAGAAGTDARGDDPGGLCCSCIAGRCDGLCCRALVLFSSLRRNS